MTTIPPELRQAVDQAGFVELTDPSTNTAYVLVKADVFRRMREVVEDEEDRREREAWAKLNRKARAAWAEPSQAGSGDSPCPELGPDSVCEG
jgi:hypothetical protein